VRDKLPEPFVDLGERQLKNIARPMRTFALAGASRGAAAIPAAVVANLAPAWREGAKERPRGPWSTRSAGRLDGRADAGRLAAGS
jgi:hypothetical protein